MVKEDIMEAISNGEITLDELAELLDTLPNVFDTRNVTILHLLLCNMNHSDVEDENMCNFYNEDLLVNAWTMKDHRKWLSRYREYLKKFKLSALDVTRELQLIVKLDADLKVLGHTPELLFSYVQNMNKD